MTWSKSIRGTAAGLALLTIPAMSHAVLFEGGYTVNANSSDPGLVIQTQKVAPDPFSFTLVNEGSSYSMALFDIWTEESWVNNDDTVAKPISVDFDFSLPGPAFGGSSGGSTVGVQGFFGFNLFQWGEVNWNAPLQLSFGHNGSGLLEIMLSDETFNKSILGLRGKGATVDATFTLLRAPTQVSEPGILAMLGLGLALIGFVLHRRRTPGTQGLTGR